MKKFISEFREFALRGNVMDLAVGVIIGAAFKTIVDSLVGDIISPFLGLFGGLDFSKMVWTIHGFNSDLGVDIRYGSFITSIINFIIMALVIFLLIKGLNSLSKIGKRIKPEKPAEPTTKVCPFCFSEIDIKATRCPHCTSEVN